jgi:hypothetical protein
MAIMVAINIKLFTWKVQLIGTLLVLFIASEKLWHLEKGLLQNYNFVRAVRERRGEERGLQITSFFF